MGHISFEKAMQIAKRKGLKPGRVKGTDGIQFTKGKNDRLEVITWDEFETTLKRRRLQVYESGGWMKIMKKKRPRVPDRCDRFQANQANIRQIIETTLSAPTEDELVILSRLAGSVVIDLLVESASKGDITVDSLLQLAEES